MIDILRKTIVAFAAHPDDLEFGATGTLMKRVAAGYQVIYVILTNGENGFKGEPVPPREERIAIRRAEQLKAAKLVGVADVIFLGHRDGFLEYTEELRARLVEIIKHYKPQQVFCWDPGRTDYASLNILHRDHRRTAEAVFDACFAAKNALMYPGGLHRIGEMYFYASDRPNHVEDISDYIDRKVEILACHASQFSQFEKVEKYIREKVSGPKDDYRHAESFRVLKVEQIQED